MGIRHTPTHSPLTLRVSGVTENSAFPTRLRLTLTLSRLCLTPSHRYSSQRRIGDALLTSRLCLSLPHIATPANGASEMRYSLETPFVRSAAEDAWGYRRPTHPSALRRCATSPSSPTRPRERSRLQLPPDSVGGTRIDTDAPRTRRRWHSPAHLFENSVLLSHSFRIESQIQ